MRAILDTSVFVAQESGRSLGALPEEVAVSVVTLAELGVGVLVATDPATRAVRLATLGRAQANFAALPVDADVAASFAALVAGLRAAGRRIGVQDAWIAATAVAHRCAVATQDDDFDGLPGVEVVRV